MSPGSRTSRLARGLVASLAVVLATACGTERGSSPSSPSPTTPTTPLPAPRSLSVGTVGGGTGTITSTDGTIQCGDFCQATYLTVVTITLTAQPDPGFMFAGFEGDPDCTDGVVTMSASVSCVARFDVPRVLSVSVTGGGAGRVTSPDSTIDCGATCSETFLITTTVTLVAVSSPGSLFAGFGGDPDCTDGSISTTTDVTCTARFEPTSTLGATSFLAFGDSLTFGIVGQSSLGRFQLVGSPESYPTVLDGLLAASYRFQTITVDNQGLSGERASDGALRLPSVLASSTAEVFLLLHGTNDLDVFRMAGIPQLAADIDSMVQQAQAAGLTVFLANLPPEDPSVSASSQEIAPLVPVLNQAIASIAATRQVTLVDLFSGMSLTLIGADGVHPTPEGYQRLADLFFVAITAQLDVPFTGGTTTSTTTSSSGPTTGDPSGSGPTFRIGRRPLPAQLRGGR